MNNLVSIIMPSFGSQRFIAASIESVIRQTYTNWELIIVDDVSPDNSNELIECYQKKDSRIKLIKLETNSGPAQARNQGIKEAIGKYIAFLDADDLWADNKLEKQITFMCENGVEFSFTSFQMIDEQTSVSVGRRTSVPSKVSYEDILKTCHIFCSTVIYNKEYFGKLYMPDILKRQDFALWLRMLKQIDFAHSIDEVLMLYRIRKESVSSNKIKAARYQWRVYRDEEKLSLISSFYYFINYAYFGIKKYKGK